MTRGGATAGRGMRNKSKRVSVIGGASTLIQTLIVLVSSLSPP